MIEFFSAAQNRTSEILYCLELSYAFVCTESPGKITDQYKENLKKASGEI